MLDVDRPAETKGRREETTVKKVLLGLVGWLVLVSGLHVWLNVDVKAFLNEYLPPGERKLNVAYIPVT